MTTNQTLRCAFGVAITYAAWQILLPVSNSVWVIILTVLAEAILFGILVFMMIQTSGGAHRPPSAVRDRIKENIARQRARLPK